MKISRSGYYNWLKNKDKLNVYEKNRLDLKEIIEELGKITGETVTEDVISEIFSKFCLGK